MRARFFGDNWGQFPWDIRGTIERYQDGGVELGEVLAECSNKYTSIVKQMYTYDAVGGKIAHTVVSFGFPVQFECVLN